MAVDTESMKEMCLGELGKRIVSIPSKWKTVRFYDELVNEGLAVVVETDKPFIRSYSITDTGRAALKTAKRTEP